MLASRAVDTITVTPATPPEAAACLAVLPNSRVPEAELLIARVDGAMAGAAAVGWLNVHDEPGFPIDVHVLPGLRHRGVGRRLVQAAIALATGETDRLWTRLPVEPDSGDSRFLETCGFRIGERIYEYRIPTAMLADQSARIVDRMRRHGRIPMEARAIPLREAPLPDVARIVAASLDRSPAAVLTGLTRGGNGTDLDRSVAVMEGDEVAGAIFGRWNDGECRIEANVVAPRFRNSYVNALLLAQSTRNILAGGAKHFIFNAREQSLDTINLAKRAGGELLSTRAFYHYALASV